MSAIAPSVAPEPPPGWRSVRLQDCPLVPWRNGAGVGRDLLHWPDEQATLVRVSVAEIERDAPFSSYPGIERHFAIVGGMGVRLHFGDGDRVVRPGDAACVFDGASAPGCTLIGGPAQAFNFMVRAGAGVARMVLVGRSAAPTEGMPPARWRGVYAGDVLHWTDDPRATPYEPPRAAQAPAWHLSFAPHA